MECTMLKLQIRFSVSSGVTPYENEWLEELIYTKISKNFKISPSRRVIFHIFMTSL